MTEHERLVENMGMLIRRMARRLEKHGEPLATVALQFLAERGLESLDAPITERKKA